MIWQFYDQHSKAVSLHPMRVESITPHGEAKHFSEPQPQSGNLSHTCTAALVTTASGYTHVTLASYVATVAAWQKALRTWVPAVSYEP